MGEMHILDYLPIWAIYLITVGIGLLAVEIGFQFGKFWRARHQKDDVSGLGAMIGSTLGLWAFLLAFLVGIASNRFDERRFLVINEANSIGTTYLRAGFLPEPYASQTRELLREYAALRLKVVELATHESAKTRSDAIHAELWKMAEEAAKMNKDPIIASYISSLNETIDLHASRVTALEAAKMPFTIYVGIYLVAILGLSMLGFQSGLNGTRNFIVTLVLILIFSLVLLVIIDLDRSWGGLLRVNQQPIRDLIGSLENFR